MKNLLLLGLIVVGALSYMKLSAEPHEADPALVASGKIQEISKGETVELTDYLAPEGLTVFEFGAEW